MDLHEEALDIYHGTTGETTSWIKQRPGNQLESFASQSSPIDAQLTLECDLETATMVGDEYIFGGLHAGLEQAIVMHFQG